MSRSLAVAAFVLALAAGLATLLVRSADGVSTQVATVGVDPVEATARLRTGDTVCQQPLRVPEGVDRVQLVVDPGGALRGPIEVSVRRTRGDATGAELAAGALPRGPLPAVPATVALRGNVPADAPVAVCLTNAGRGAVDVRGDVGGDGSRTPSTSAPVRDGEPLPGDLFLTFPRDRPVSQLSQLTAAFAHAAPFKLGGIGAWAFWLLAALLLAAVLGLAAAVGRAARDDARR